MDFVTSTAYFPPLAWFRAGAQGQWKIEAHENYQKGDWRNRCRIATANGPLLLTVPLEGGKHRRMPIREVRISYRNDWWRQHEQSIRSAYGKAPFYEHFAEELFAVARRRPVTLWELNQSLIGVCCELLQLEVPKLTDRFSGPPSPFPPDSYRDPAQASLPYPQVFSDRHGFLADLSVLDGLFCLGPAAVL